MRLVFLAASLVFLSACAFGEKPAEPQVADAPASVGRPPATAGQMCGGIAGFACAEGLSCYYGKGICRRVADAAGKCAAPPTACTREYLPVCGCDGETYGNECEARANGTSVASAGKCAAAED